MAGIEPTDQAALDEFRQLREEKAADWRLITQTTAATLATAAAIVAAGLSIHSYTVIVAAPLPFYVGVLYMVQSARLQVRLITFLASRAPAGALNYEKKVLDSHDNPRLQKLMKFSSAWAWWIGVATL